MTALSETHVEAKIASARLDEPSFEVRDASLNASEVSAGDAAAVSATVENVGSGSGTETVELTTGGEVVATEEVTLGTGEQTTITFVRTFDESGEYDVAIGSESAGTLVVTADEMTTARGTTANQSNESGEGSVGDGGDGGVPGFGVSAAVAALFAAALLARRTQP